jgi:hypothetical protein
LKEPTLFNTFHHFSTLFKKTKVWGNMPPKKRNRDVTPPRQPLGSLPCSSNSSKSHPASIRASEAPAEQTVAVDPYAARTSTILQGLTEVNHLGVAMTIGEIQQLRNKYKTQKFVLLKLAQKLDIVVQPVHTGLAEFRLGVEEARLPATTSFADTTAVSSVVVRDAPCDGDEDLTDSPPFQAFSMLITELADVLEDPCGNLEAPFLRVAGIDNASLCAALGQQVLQTDPATRLPPAVAARVVAVFSHFGCFQEGQGAAWLERVVMSHHNSDIAVHLDPSAVLVTPLPAVLAATLAALPTHGGNFAVAPVAGLVPPVGHPAHAAGPLHPNLITCHNASDAKQLAGNLVMMHPGTTVLRFSTTGVGFQFTW